ncbi:MAG: ribosome biogenesis GTPase YlqF [Granulosicoccaceae bacterium]
MAIQWYPGHMHKARVEMKKVLPATDIIIEILDSRIPYSSENPMLKELRGDKPCLKLLTKADLSDSAATEQWVKALRTPTIDTMAITTADADTSSAVRASIKQLVTGSKSRVKPFVAMVVGIPNVGKSTLINQLAGRTAAKTGNEPAITKRQQPISLGDNWVLRDTPGVLWPNVENRHSGYRLAATGAIKDTAMDSADVAVYLLEYLMHSYPQLLTERYSVSLPIQDAVEVLEIIGKSRGCLAGGGLVDFDRAARLVLTEYRAGTIGGITLETPDMRIKEFEEVELQRLKKAEKEARKRGAKKPSR